MRKLPSIMDGRKNEELIAKNDKSVNKIDDDDVIFTSYLKFKEERIFNPISKSWQVLKCKQLQLQFRNTFKNKGKRKVLGEPTTTKNIIGDGNCLFRAICYWLTGDEDDHLIVRKLISEVVQNNVNIIKYVGGKEKHDIYLQKNPIENNGVWGTDVEMFGAVLLLDTSIYVYTTKSKTWQLFNKHMDLRKPLHKSEKCIYLRNINNVHYDVVMNV